MVSKFASYFVVVVSTVETDVTKVFQSRKIGGGDNQQNRRKSRENERMLKNGQKPHKNEGILGILWGGIPPW